jgi:hypothetical protein
MLRLCEIRTRRLAGVTGLVVAFSVGAVAPSSALAVEGGPVWIAKLCLEKTGGHYLTRSAAGKCGTFMEVGEGPYEEVLQTLGAGEKATTLTSGGVFVLEGAQKVECASEKASGELLGGNPGTSTTTIKYEQCHVFAKPHCLATNKGEEEIEVVGLKSVLVYPDGKAETAEEALNAFVPGGATNTFSEFELKNATGTTECTINKLLVTVNAVGSEVKTSGFNKDCGALGLVGKLEGGIFAKTKSGEAVALGALESSGVPTAAELWEGSSFKLIECKLQAFGTTASEVGTSDVELESGEASGWES